MFLPCWPIFELIALHFSARLLQAAILSSPTVCIRAQSLHESEQNTVALHLAVGIKLSGRHAGRPELF